MLSPVLTVSTVSPVLNATLPATFYYEADGVKYQEQVIPLTTVLALSTWPFTPPEKHYTEPVRDPDTGTLPRPIPSETPALAFPVLRLSAKNSAQVVVLDLYTANSALNGDSAWPLTSSCTFRMPTSRGPGPRPMSRLSVILRLLVPWWPGLAHW